jgi:hypothetical protein
MSGLRLTSRVAFRDDREIDGQISCTSLWFPLAAYPVAAGSAKLASNPAEMLAKLIPQRDRTK